MIHRLIILLLIVGCGTIEPEDCAGVVGGTAVVDECGNCGAGEDCLVGSWKSTESKLTYNLEGTINISNENEYYLYVFNSDGTGNYTSSQSTTPNEFMISLYTGTWIVNNNQIVYEGQNIINGNTIVTSWYFNLNEEILILSNIENYEHEITNGMYLILEKE